MGVGERKVGVAAVGRTAGDYTRTVAKAWTELGASVLAVQESDSVQHATCSAQYSAYNMQHSACNMQLATDDTQHVTCSIQHSACNMQRTTCSMQHAAWNRRHATCNSADSMQQTTALPCLSKGALWSGGTAVGFSRRVQCHRCRCYERRTRLTTEPHGFAEQVRRHCGQPRRSDRRHALNESLISTSVLQTSAGVGARPCLTPWARAAAARLDAVSTRGVRAALRLGAELPPLAAWEIGLPDECASYTSRQIDR